MILNCVYLPCSNLYQTTSIHAIYVVASSYPRISLLLLRTVVPAVKVDTARADGLVAGIQLTFEGHGRCSLVCELLLGFRDFLFTGLSLVLAGAGWGVGDFQDVLCR